MIISKKHHFIFIHIPKNAGSYLRSFLHACHDVPFNFYGVTTFSCQNIEITKDLHHVNCSDLKKYIPQIHIDLNKYYKFCVVREPISRFKSAYIEYTNHIKEYFNTNPLSIEEVLEVLLHHKDLLNDSKYVHFFPQTYYTHTHDDKLVVNEIFSLKNLDEMYLRLNSKYDLKKKEHSKKNVTKNKPFFFKIELSNEQIQKLYAFYKRDFDLLSKYF